LRKNGLKVYKEANVGKKGKKLQRKTQKRSTRLKSQHPFSDGMEASKKKGEVRWRRTQARLKG